VSEKLRHLGNLSLIIAWVAVFLLMPITSLPIFSRLAGGAEVAPAALLPLGWLVFFWFIPHVFKKGAIPRESIPFIFFLSVAIISSAAAFFLDIPPFKNASISHVEFKSIFTLLIGAAFYLVTASWLSEFRSRLTFVLKWINVSGFIVIVWATIQAIYIFLFQGHYPDILLTFQHLVSTRGLWIDRVTAFAFEPSWLAHQMNLIYLPFWLGATISGTSASRFRLWKISLENILLLLGMGVVFLASRVGTLALLLVLAFVGVYANVFVARRAYQWSLIKFTRFSAFIKRTIRILLPLLLLFTFIAIYILGAVGLIYGLSRFDKRLARFFQPQSLKQWAQLTQNPYVFFNYLAFAERYVYWVGGWNIFNIHPILGVGLGNAGFFFQRELPAYSWNLPEIMDVYNRASALPNIKSLWIRLLAETGIVGFSSFIAWLYVVFRLSWFVRLSKNPLFRTIGWSGLCVLLAFTIEGFSTDTFALPYLWVSLGIVSAVGAMMRNSTEKS
jgi:O-Antigen ligase